MEKTDTGKAAEVEKITRMKNYRVKSLFFIKKQHFGSVKVVIH